MLNIFFFLFCSSSENEVSTIQKTFVETTDKLTMMQNNNQIGREVKRLTQENESLRTNLHKMEYDNVQQQKQ